MRPGETLMYRSHFDFLFVFLHIPVSFGNGTHPLSYPRGTSSDRHHHVQPCPSLLKKLRTLSPWRRALSATWLLVSGVRSPVHFAAWAEFAARERWREGREFAQ